jgi:hypothetical protein
MGEVVNHSARGAIIEPNVHPIILVSLHTSLKSTALFRKLHKKASRHLLIFANTQYRFSENLGS